MNIGHSNSILVRLLAAYEACWMPIRGDWSAASAIYQRRLGNIQCRLGGSGGVAVRQQLSRVLGDLRDDGLLDAGERLTAAGRHKARSLAWTFTRRELTTALVRLQRAVERGDFMERPADERLVPEMLIAGAWWGVQCAMLQRLFLPALADGLIESQSDAMGFTSYRFASWPADVDEIIAVSMGNGRRAYNDDAAGLYQREFERHRQSMLTDGTYYSELGACPCGDEPLVSGRNAYAYADIPRLFTWAKRDGFERPPVEAANA